MTSWIVANRDDFAWLKVNVELLARWLGGSTITKFLQDLLTNNYTKDTKKTTGSI